MTIYLTGIIRHDELQIVLDILEAKGYKVTTSLECLSEMRTDGENTITRRQALMDAEAFAAPENISHLDGIELDRVVAERKAARVAMKPMLRVEDILQPMHA